MSDTSFIQPMPELSADEYSALREDIRARGVLVPVVVDQHGRILDGNNRVRIAGELGVQYPTETVTVADENDAIDLAITLNCARRHLSREQLRAVIVAELVRRPEDSDREIARRVGCDHKTVGSVRKGPSKSDGGEVPQAMSREDAEKLTQEIRTLLDEARGGMLTVCMMLLSNKVAAGEILISLTRAKRGARSGLNTEMALAVDVLFDPVMDYVLDPASSEAWKEHWDHETFSPMSDDEIRTSLKHLESVGAQS